jgi:transcriptional regulator with XRE-family HTH domain
MRSDRVERERIILALKARRQALGLSQDTLEKQTHCGNAAIGRYERGETTPTLGLLIRWARALDMRITVGDAQ